MNSADSTQSSSRGIYQEIVRLQQAGRRAALATPLWLSGSVPLVLESLLLVRDEGSALGTIGGGPLEAEVLRQAAEVIAQDEPRIAEFDLTQDEAADSGMICGGQCAVLIEPIGEDRAVQVYAAAARAEAAGERAAIITIIPEQGALRKLALLPDGVLLGTSGDAVNDDALRELGERCRAEERPCFVKEPVRAHLQPVFASPCLCVFGAGHIAVPVAHLADLVGFRTIVIDDRSEFANARRFPRSTVLVAGVDDAFERLAIGEGAYVVAVTRGHALDEEVVARALRTRARYIGMIGSKRKVAAIRERLLRRGFDEDDLSRLHAPVGLQIGAETVEEIALSIVAEIVAVRRGSG
ncbi:MAG: XdhC family protein [Armatimonadota bacterium]|nr:MAG: XdhC family protein [Armatimonadota bacterium]